MISLFSFARWGSLPLPAPTRVPLANIKRVALFAFFGSCASLLSSDRVAHARDADQFEILTGFSAKESCSCAFVVDQTDAYCQAFGKIGTYELTIAIDRQAKTVTSSITTISRTARFTDGAGCVTDALTVD
jgi:hypothetical protein